jgi:hypothetical protein
MLVHTEHPSWGTTKHKIKEFIQEVDSERKPTMIERDRRTLRRIVSKNHRTTAAQVTLQQNWIFIMKSLFPRKISDVSITNPTPPVGMQLLNFWLLKVMLRCVNGGVTTVKTTGNASVISVESSILHAVLYSSKSLCLKNTEGNLQSGMSGSNSETRGRICDDLGNNIMVAFCLLALLPVMAELLQESTWPGWILRCIS